MRCNVKSINHAKLLAAVLAVNGFVGYAMAQDSAPASDSSTPPSASHNLSQGVVVPGSSHVVSPNPANTANSNPNTANPSTGVLQSDGSRLMPDGTRVLINGTRVLVNGNSVLADGSVVSANGTVISGPTSVANGGSVNDTGVVNPNVNPNTNVGATPAGATINPDGTTTLNNGATIDTSERGTARGTVNSNGTVNNGAAGAGNSAGVGAGAANSAGVGAANSAGAGAANSAGAGASNSAGAGASNSAGAGASNSAGVGASNAAGAGAASNVPAGSKTNSSGTNNSGNSTGGASGAGHVDASSVISGPIYLDDLSVYSRRKPNKDTPDTSSPHADEAIPSSSTVNDETLPIANDSSGVRAMLAKSTEDALSKDGCERLCKNFDKLDQKRIDFSQAKFDDLNAKIDQFNQDWREKYGRDFAISQPEIVFNDEYRFTPGVTSTDAARTASETIRPTDEDRIAPTSGNKDLSARSDLSDPRIQYRTTTSEESQPVGVNGERFHSSVTVAHDNDQPAGDLSNSSASTERTAKYSESAEEASDNPTGQLLPRDATYHDGTKMKADGTIQRNDISAYNSRPNQVNVPTGNSINDRDSANHDRPDPKHAAEQRDVIDASAQQSSQRIERAYDQTSTRTEAKADSSADLRSGQTAEIDSRTGTVRRDVAGDGVILRGPDDSAQIASDVRSPDQQCPSAERSHVIVPASYGLAQLTVPMVKEDGQWKLCVPDNVDAQKLHDCLVRHISMMDDQKATWPTDVNDAQRMANHHILAAIYESQQKSAPLSGDAEK